MESLANKSLLRNQISDPTLKTKVQHIWDDAQKELHPFQQGLSGQDFLHSTRVEENIWKLIRDNLGKFSNLDMYLLSAAAALHDMGKIPVADEKTPIEDHGERAKQLLMKDDNWRKIHFDQKNEAEAVAKIISVHDKGELERLPDDAFTINSETVKLRSLAAIFRLADMLDTDSRRCPYITKIIKEMKYPVDAWVGRTSIGGWLISNDGKSILLQASPNTEEEKIKTLAYIDSLNRQLTNTHKKYLENCPVEFYSENKWLKEVLHFPIQFIYCEFDGASRKEITGLSAYYDQYAVEYLDKAKMIFSGFTLKGIGDFSDKRSIKLSNIFINAHASLYVDLSPTVVNDFKAQVWINEHMPKDDTTKRVLTSELLELPGINRLILLGDPGSGKSMISQNFILSRLDSMEQKIGFIHGVPFLVTIREYAFASKSQNLTIIDYISQQIKSFTGKQPPTGFVEYYLKDSALVVFDGLDEVIVTTEREYIRNSIDAFAREFPDAKIAVTSRFVGYDEMPLNNNNFLHFILNSFDQQEKCEFIKKWYAERESNPSERDRSIKGFMEALKDERVDELANNPLMLTIMAIVHSSEHDLPRQRALLYKKCVEAFIESREKSKELISYNSREIWECHDYLGYCIQNKAEKEQGTALVFSSEELKHILYEFISQKNHSLADKQPSLVEKKVNEFLEGAQRRVGLIVESGESRWGFGHKSFQEYFAAHYISQTTSGVPGIWQEISMKVDDPHWTEPIKLLAGICGDFSPKLLHDFVQKILEDYGKVQDIEHKRLILAGEIAGEIELDSDDQTRIATELVNQFISTTDSTMLTNLKRVMNNFYNNSELWANMTQILKERIKIIKENPFYCSQTAFYRCYDLRRFGDSRIDRILATF